MRCDLVIDALNYSTFLKKYEQKYIELNREEQ